MIKLSRITKGSYNFSYHIKQVFGVSRDRLYERWVEMSAKKVIFFKEKAALAFSRYSLEFTFTIKGK